MLNKQDSQSRALTFPIEASLRDDTRVLIRPIQAEDKHFFEIGIEHLSKQGRYFRFFHPVSNLSEKLLRQFTEIDHFDHEAIGAMDISQSPSEPVGVARYIRIPDRKTTAEVAVTVADSYQGRGAGTLILGLLAHRAVENGINEFAANVLMDNSGMLKLFRKLGSITKSAKDGVIDVRIPLFSDPSCYPQTPAGNVFRIAAAMLRPNR